MSGKYIKCYIGKNDIEGNSQLNEFLGLIEKKNWDKLYSIYGNKLNLLIDYSDEETLDKDELHEELNHCLDMLISRSEEEDHICYTLDAFTSFGDEGFMDLLNDMDLKRIELSLEHTGACATYYYLDGKHIKEYENQPWQWMKITRDEI